MNVTSNDGTWSEDGKSTWNNSGGVRLGYGLGGTQTGKSTLTKTFDKIPADIQIVAKSQGDARGSRFFADIATTYYFYVSGTSAGTATAKGNNSSTPFDINKTMTLTKDNPTIQHYNSTATNTACSVVTACSIYFAE